MYNNGFVVGKFYPPHRGHKHLIDTACANSRSVTVMLVGRPEEAIPFKLRAQWLREIHPDVTVIEVDDVHGADDSQGWAKFTIQTLGYAPDAVFSSENYGETFAHFLGCRHIMVDHARGTVPCSGTAVRKAPFAAWDYLEPCVRAYFVKRICVLGAESTGTTTMAKALAAHYNAPWVAEYGREYCEEKFAGRVISDGDEEIEDHWDTKEFIHIAQTQCERENAAARSGSKLLICDTNAFATNIWHERYIGALSPEVEAIALAQRYDLILLTNVDIPFVQDGTRDGERIRHAMHERFAELLAAQTTPFAILSGAHEDRLREAVRLIDGLRANQP
ncbi:trifunctional nicotinamide-nucleotide adenylyltransferase/ribosylnicotinamide kinase/transcriptional regulator NadR [Capsulimonas corticalis]|uniref:Trifunctional nicotinamide-nucleotide adenylyltransferase/ribosylnicotinamide kinase/transcriptional regulator NadR n=1 Tax=Capsulimonas corticalis TaxID=2219043 RepID=A0A402CQL8_9BACT|nr:AAA family ATPase [Capsulimonas corticalis]BDI32622.1 trifunctional nicotinamide-nucleotide adenylyltransferase/ribosylnicotinamide kinase/transcriptional regulator NadR [Capsulimonas corticalis]